MILVKVLCWVCGIVMLPFCAYFVAFGLAIVRELFHQWAHYTLEDLPPRQYEEDDPDDLLE